MNDLRIAVLNLPEYTVSEILSAVKQALEGYFGCVGVSCEITAPRWHRLSLRTTRPSPVRRAAHGPHSFHPAGIGAARRTDAGTRSRRPDRADGRYATR